MRQDIPAGGNDMPTALSKDSVPAADVTRLSEAVSRLNDYVQSINRNIEFTVNEEINRIVVKVYNLETAEVIREIPAEEVLSMSRYISRRGARVLKMDF
jgi:flagellar protein FlaG